MKATVPANLRCKCDAVGISQNAADLRPRLRGAGFARGRRLWRAVACPSVLFDLPDVCAGTRPLLEATGLLARTTLVGGDFFRCIPPGAHLYVLKSVIHDWDDEQAQRILASCRAAMTPGARLLLIERVVGEANEIAEAKLFDINMLAMLGGRERTRGEYRALLGAAGFRMTRMLAAASPLSIIEAAPIE